MIKKFLFYLWQSRMQFLKYFSIGISAFALDIITLYIFKEFFDIKPVMAVVINQFLIISFIFLLNKFFSFKAGGSTSRQIFRFAVVLIGNYLFAIFWMWFFNQKLAFNYLLTRTVNVALAVSWNFILYREWVYRIPKTELPKIEL